MFRQHDIVLRRGPRGPRVCAEDVDILVEVKLDEKVGRASLLQRYRHTDVRSVDHRAIRIAHAPPSLELRVSSQRVNLSIECLRSLRIAWIYAMEILDLVVPIRVENPEDIRGVRGQRSNRKFVADLSVDDPTNV